MLLAQASPPHSRRSPNVNENRNQSRTSKNTLIVPKQHERQLTSDRNRSPQLKPPAIPIEMRCLQHRSASISLNYPYKNQTYSPKPLNKSEFKRYTVLNPHSTLIEKADHRHRSIPTPHPSSPSPPPTKPSVRTPNNSWIIHPNHTAARRDSCVA